MPNPQTDLHDQARTLLAAVHASPVDYGAAKIRDIRERAKGFPVPPADWSMMTADWIEFDHSEEQIRCKRYTSQRAYSGSLQPVILYVHGGGWCMNHPDDFDALCAALCQATNIDVLSVDYPLAPETPFPGPALSVYRTLQSLQSNAAQFGYDASKVIVAGDSAGGNLAASAMLRARDNNTEFPLAQILIYPVLDYGTASRGFDLFGEGYLLNRAGMDWCWRQYLKAPADAASPYAAPLKATSFAGLPPTLIVSAAFDPLFDQAENYLSRMLEAGNACVLNTYPSIHAFLQFARDWPDSSQAIDDIAGFIRSMTT